MTATAKAISAIALMATIVPSLLLFAGLLSHDVVKWSALAGSVVWFLTTPVWMGRDLPLDADAVEI